MKEFLKLNKVKLKFAFGITSIISLAFVSGILVYSFFKDQFPDLNLLIIVLLVAGIGMPLFLVGIVIVRGTWDLSKRRNAFTKEPFSELIHHGFVFQLKYATNKWKFAEPVLLGKIGDYQIIVEVDTQYAPKEIRFQALTKLEEIEKDKVDRLRQIFKIDNIEFDFEGVTKRISIRDHRIGSVKNLLKELNRFICFINNENFKPKGKKHNIPK